MIFQKNPITLGWLCGFFESDGGFTASFSGESLKLTAKFSQKTNSNLLLLINDFLSSYGISSTFDLSKKSDRAPALRIQGNKQVQKFISLLESENKSHPFIGKTQKQFLIFKELSNNNSLSLDEQKLLLEYNRSGEPEDSFSDKDPSFIRKIKQDYKNHKSFIFNKIKSKPSVGHFLEADFVSGLLDGDGSYSVSYQFKDPDKKWNKKRVEWTEVFVFSTDKDSQLTAISLLCHVGCPDIPIYVAGKNKGGITFSLKKQEFITNLIETHKKFPLLGVYSRARFNLILEFRELKSSNGLKNKQKVINFLRKLHQVTSVSLKGRPKKYSLDEAILKLDDCEF